jgi:hypothetical protein
MTARVAATTAIQAEIFMGIRERAGNGKGRLT